ncbi:hypothetical protein GSY74_05210 [Sulfurovum sp. bin170]|uniref:immunoglobulin-like domain-containing protein n=1 Tax=Sulfurovum sp. bin170 TaxID=2695268 RepID=UPI0013E00D6E|nr:immunoglobulin-like domain-containing protein [Sulfurovum sp. bin170]NEW60676.1 hypothetical protein [Sulfurovum sp. bin170]
MMRKNSTRELIFFVGIALLLTACGESSSCPETSESTPSTTTTATRTQIGTVVDAPISNITYTCGSTIAKTDAQGRFACSKFPVTFSVLGIEVGSIDAMTADAVIYPQDLVGVSRDDFNNDDVLKIAIFLQSLDDDGDMSTTINIPDTLVLEGNQKLDDLSLEEMQKLLIDNEIDPISEASAKEHLREHSSVPGATGEATEEEVSGAEEVIEKIEKPILLTTLSSATSKDNITIEIQGLVNGKIFVNGVAHGVIDDNGKAELTLTLSDDDGENSFSITLKNTNGEESEALLIDILKDTVAPDMPSLEVSLPIETENNQYTLSIYGENQTTVYINGSNMNRVISDEKATVVVGLIVGDNQFDITLKDEAKNTSEASIVHITRKAPPQMGDAEAVDLATSDLNLGDTSSVSSNMSLPTTGLHGTTISYSSSNTAVLSNTGVVTSPESGSVTVTLTATISKGSSSMTKSFSVTIVEELPTF